MKPILNKIIYLFSNLWLAFFSNFSYRVLFVEKKSLTSNCLQNLKQVIFKISFAHEIFNQSIFQNKKLKSEYG